MILKATGVTTTPVEAFVVIEIDKMAIESKVFCLQPVCDGLILIPAINLYVICIVVVLQLSKKEITPQWEELVSLPAKDGNASIDVCVKQSMLLRCDVKQHILNYFNSLLLVVIL